MESPARLQVSEDAFGQDRQDPHTALILTERYQGLTREQVRGASSEC